MTDLEDNADRENVHSFRRILLATVFWAMFAGVAFFSVVQWRYWDNALSDRSVFSNSSFSRNRLKGLAMALYACHELTGALPPAYSVDENGSPLNSWRSFILPFIELDELFKKFRFNEPWDSPHNKSLLIPIEVYGTSNRASKVSVNFFAVVGPETVWPNGSSISYSDITDGTSKTILLIELPELNIPWSEPVDVEFDGKRVTLRGEPIEWPLATHQQPANWFWQDSTPYTNIAFVDGSVYNVPLDTPNELLYSALTRAGGEAGDLKAYLQQHRVGRSAGIEWATLVGLPFFTGIMLIVAWCATFPRRGRLLTLLAFQLIAVQIVTFFLKIGRFRTDYDITVSVSTSVIALAAGYIIYEFALANRASQWRH